MGKHKTALFYLLLFKLQLAAGGKSSTRAGGIGTATKIDGSSFNKKKESTQQTYRHQFDTASNNTGKRTIDLLKEHLLRGYDKHMFPLNDYNQSVHVTIDFTYRQILDLDEKNQVLKSLIWLRLQWYDDHFIWNPYKFEGINKIMLSANSIWRPDVLVYEDTSSNDVNPRLPYAIVYSSGKVMWNEPEVLETSCRMNTAFFPFDSQICHLTFVSWTHPLAQIDLSAKQDEKSLSQDANEHFIQSGEWMLKKIKIQKVVTEYNYSVENITEETSIFLDVNNTDRPFPNHVHSKENKKFRRFAVLPHQRVNSSFLEDRQKVEFMFAELKFTVFVQRNSSLYMQSMLFPGILLTTVAVFGFYLPPDSGERVGLQITILLTFMVFLLTVGEMFPASTGPYLGIYFVMCMAILGLNILMTIIVLHIHFKPCADLSKAMVLSEQMKNNFQSNKTVPVSSIPPRLRIILKFFSKFLYVAEAGATWMLPLTNEEVVQANPFKLWWKKYERNADYIAVHTNDDYESTNEQGIMNRKWKSCVNIYGYYKNKENTRSLENQNLMNRRVNGNMSRYLSIPNLQLARLQQDETSTLHSDIASTRDKRHAKCCYCWCIRKRKIAKRKAERRFSRMGLQQNGQISGCVAHDGLNDDNTFPDCNIEEAEDKIAKKREHVQEEWKSVARAIDRLFFRLYILVLIISHCALFGTAFHGFMKQDY